MSQSISIKKTIACVIPQRFVQGFSIFLMLVKDLKNQCNHSKIATYANDGTIRNAGEKSEEILGIPT